MGPAVRPAVVDLRSGVVIGYRGFARLQHKTLGPLHASTFIDLIAETALANEVDLYVPRETAAVLLLAASDTALRLYTPVARRTIADLRTEQYLSEIGDAFFLPMHRIIVQLARPLLDGWTPALEDALQSLRDADVSLALTDIDNVADARELADRGFGELHLSRRLTRDALGDPAARSTVAEIARVAQDRGLLVAARGVDSTGLRDAVVEAGCDLASGDLFGKPEPANTIEGLDPTSR